MTSNKSLPVIQSLQTGIHIIELIVEQDRPLKFTDIQELTGMTKSNLHKYLNTLTLAGLLFRDKNDGSYFLGSKLIEFGNAAIGSEDVIGRTVPLLKEISRKLQLTTLLSVWTHDGPVIANIWSANLGLNIGAQIGTRLPLLSSAGKLFLAFKHSPDVAEWKRKGLLKLTAKQKSELTTEIKTIHKTYFSYAAEPLVEQVSSFSVPILNYRNDIIGTLTVVGFNQLIPRSPEDEMSQFVLRKATDLSETFGWRHED